MCQIVTSVFPDNAFSPEYTADSSVTNPHYCDGDDVSYNEVDNVVTESDIRQKMITQLRLAILVFSLLKNRC